MEINKQLFEDVLSGKLKGTFILRNGQSIKSNTLKRSSEDNFPYKILIKYDNGTLDYGTFKSNGDFQIYNISHLDIINFIPDTNMKQNELTIEIPDGKIVDWDESKKQDKIVLKDKPLTYNDICEKLFKADHYAIAWEGYPIECCSAIYNASNATTEHQLECILAKNKLANVAKYLNNGWKPSKNDFGQFDAWLIYVTPNKDFIGYTKISNCGEIGNVLFKSAELAKKAIEILGKETIKLALEPLGI